MSSRGGGVGHADGGVFFFSKGPRRPPLTATYRRLFSGSLASCSCSSFSIVGRRGILRVSILCRLLTVAVNGHGDLDWRGMAAYHGSQAAGFNSPVIAECSSIARPNI